MTHKVPIPNIAVRATFLRVGSCRLHSIGIGRMIIITSMPMLMQAEAK